MVDLGFRVGPLSTAMEVQGAWQSPLESKVPISSVKQFGALRTGGSAHPQEAACLAENSQPLGAKLDGAREVRRESRARVCTMPASCREEGVLYRGKGHERTVRLPAFSGSSLWKRENSTAFSYLRIFASTIPNGRRVIWLSWAVPALPIFHTEVQPLSFST